MSYQVLARQYRPKSFQAMVGQEHVLRALINALEQQRLHHAYLFTGTRGVGKTTVARILAKCLNCESGITSTPCGQCQTCQEIDTGRYIDLFEVDAASRTKVEDTRELLENVQYLPQRGRYKIYLIDEVHMLSGHSFNALLKTLEEPPAHVIFLLATTDPEKLPVTVLSRCLQFHLKNIPEIIIEKYLAEVLQKENITHEAPALKLIAKAAQGSMRDALSLLDQGISYGGGKVTEAEMLVMLGTVSDTKIFELLDLLSKQNAEGLLNKAAELAELGADFLDTLNEMLSLLQKIAVAQLLNQGEETILALAKQFKPEDVQLYYQIALLGKKDLALAPNPQVGFEMVLIRMLAFTPGKVSGRHCESRSDAAISNKIPTSHTTCAPRNDNVSTPWSDILTKLNLSGVTQLLAANCVLEKMQDSMIELTLDTNHAALLNNNTQERLTKALDDHFGKKHTLKIRVDKPTTETPAGFQQRIISEKKQNATQQLQQDAKLNSLMEKFSATLKTDTITTIEE